MNTTKKQYYVEFVNIYSEYEDTECYTVIATSEEEAIDEAYKEAQIFGNVSPFHVSEVYELQPVQRKKRRDIVSTVTKEKISFGLR